MKTYNYQIAGFIRRVRRFRFETCKAVSSAVSHVNQYDMDRARAYLKAARAYIEWVISQPQLDLPESSPREIDLGELQVLPMPENESLADMMAMYELMETEVGNSQSSRLGDSIIKHDQMRIIALLDKMELFLGNYVSNILPIDFPESAPLREQTGPGRTGV